MTPISCESSVHTKQEGNTDRVYRYDRADHEDYIREDLSCQVFVDYEVFTEHVLHVPDDWQLRWGLVIETIKTNADFEKYHKNYCG